MSQTLQSVLCITTNIYLVRVLVVLLHACFSVVSPIPFLLAAIFFSGHPYIKGSTTVLPDMKNPRCITHVGLASLAQLHIALDVYCTNFKPVNIKFVKMFCTNTILGNV